jgi:hypothetical protein
MFSASTQQYSRLVSHVLPVVLAAQEQIHGTGAGKDEEVEEGGQGMRKPKDRH